MPASNVARIGIGLQTAKGVEATAPLYWLNLTGGGMRPTPETEQRSETGLGRDVGATFIRVLSAAGDPSFLLTSGQRRASLLRGPWRQGCYRLRHALDFSASTYTLGQVIRGVDGKIYEVTTAGYRRHGFAYWDDCRTGCPCHGRRCCLHASPTQRGAEDTHALSGKRSAVGDGLEGTRRGSGHFREVRGCEVHGMLTLNLPLVATLPSLRRRWDSALSALPPLPLVAYARSGCADSRTRLHLHHWRLTG